MSGLEIANSIPMWVIAFVTVSIVVLQAILIGSRSFQFNKENSILSDDEVKKALRTGSIVSIGPALSVFVLAVSMIATLGAPVTLMRVGIIGSAPSELMAANVGTEMMGVSLGQETLTKEALTTALFAMASMSMGYLIFVPFLTRGLGKSVMNVITPGENNKHKKLATFFGVIFPLVIYLLLVVSQVYGSLENTATLIFSALMMIFLDRIGNKMKWTWMGEWAMGIAVLLSMIFGTCLSVIIGG